MSEYDARLAQRVSSRGSLPPDEAARLLLPVADALASLHGAGHVHGAVSAESVVLDAGRGRLLEAAEAVPDPAFTAPEVAAGARPTAEADVWSIAAVLHQVTTGRAPYSGPVGPRAGGWLRPLLQLALSTNPSERPTAAEVGDYLRARVAPSTGVTRAEPSDAPGARRGSRSAALLGAAVVVLLAVVGGSLLLVGGGEDPEVEAAPATSAPRGDGSRMPGRSGGIRKTSARPTAAELARFARAYVRTASADPDRGFAQLTRAYQLASPRYHEVWSAIEDPRILEVEAAPRRLSVTYTYAYTLPDGQVRTEEVTLRLVRRGERLLIAAATARQL